jgi:ABC-2 type transport system permease protein
MKNVWKVWMDEYRAIFTDAGGALIFFGAIVIYPFFYSLPYLPEVLRDIPVAVVDGDHSALSRKLIRMLDAHENLAVAARFGDLESAKKAFFQREAHGIIVIPAGFEKKALRREQATVVLYGDASYFLTYRQTMLGCTQVGRTLSAGMDIRRLQAKGATPSQALALRAPVQGAAYPLFNPAGGYATFVVQFSLVALMQQTLIIGICMLAGTARERKQAIQPAGGRGASGLETVLGKAGAYFSIYFFHAIYLFQVVPWVFRFARRGHPLDLMIFIVPFLLATIFLGLAVSRFFKSREMSILVVAFTSLPILLVSGFPWPPEAIPAWLLCLGKWVPSTPGINGFLIIGQMGGTLREAISEWSLLWLLSAVYLLAALYLFRRNRNKITS